MPVEVVQFCWKYNAERLKNLPEVAGCEVVNQFVLILPAMFVAASLSILLV